MKIAHTALAALLVLSGLSVRLLAADPAPDTAKATVKGQVVYGEPVAKISVTLEGAVKKTARTDEKGQFVFTDIPPGEYTLSASGVAKNNLRKGSATVTVPQPPQELAPITIKLGS